MNDLAHYYPLSEDPTFISDAIEDLQLLTDAVERIFLCGEAPAVEAFTNGDHQELGRLLSEAIHEFIQDRAQFGETESIDLREVARGGRF